MSGSSASSSSGYSATVLSVCISLAGDRGQLTEAEARTPEMGTSGTSADSGVGGLTII